MATACEHRSAIRHGVAARGARPGVGMSYGPLPRVGLLIKGRARRIAVGPFQLPTNVTVDRLVTVLRGSRRTTWLCLLFARACGRCCLRSDQRASRYSFWFERRTPTAAQLVC